MRLLDRTPFDQIVIHEQRGGQTLDVLPLDLPQRPLPARPTEGTIKVRLLDRPGEVFEVSWSDVADIRVFEELLLDEANRLTAAGKFDEAYDYFARLVKEYPSLPGLQKAVSEYLRRNALALYQAGDRDRALAVLITLHQQNPQYAGLASAVQTIAGEIIQRYLREGNYSAARSVLDVWRSEFAGLAAAAASDWQRRFEAAATRQLDEALQYIQQNEYIAARKSAGRALAIWPKLAAAKEVLARIKHEYPFITIGVFERAPQQPRWTIDDWAAIRTSRLVERLLVEETGFGADGGIYRSPYGDLQLDDAGRELSLVLNSSRGTTTPEPAALTPDGLCRYLLSLAEPGSPHVRSDFASLLSGVSIAADNRVQLHFSRAHVRPESLLRQPLPGEQGPSQGEPRLDMQFSITEQGPNQVVFAAGNSQSHVSSAVRALVEETMPNDEAAVDALVAGEIDVLDRVPPWQVERLRAVQDVRLETYRLPTVHVLIPNFAHPLPAQREFRRALCYGIDRKWIVERVLLGNATLPGFVVQSGPFPAGVSLSDPVRYGYNSQIEPRPFEPRLAAVLATAAWARVRPAKDKAEPLELPELVLAHPQDPVDRLACQSIKSQLERVGIHIQLQEFRADDLLAGRVDCDLRYAELAVWEPLADARRILGPSGLVGDIDSPYLDAALRRLDVASNWKDVRSELAVLHEIAHHELPVIPLWQTLNYFAYRASVGGIDKSPMTLYQNVEGWHLAAAADVARLERRD